jgi:hypothetical protein
MSDGRCPSCLKSFVEATQIEADRAAALRQEQEFQGQRAARNAQANRQMLVGAAVFLVGCAITWMTYSMVSESAGGSYIVCTGAIVGGLVQMLRGYIRRF